MDLLDWEKPIITSALGWIGFVTWGSFRSIFNGATNERIEKRIERIEDKLDSLAEVVASIRSVRYRRKG